MNVNIGYIDTYIPEHGIPIEDVIKKVNEEENLNYDVNDYGFIQNCYHINRDDEEKIFKLLISKYIETNRLDGSEIDFLIYNQTDTCLSKQNMLFNIQRDLDLKNAQVLSVGQGCSGSIMAMKVASALIKDGSAKSILILSSCFSNHDVDRFVGQIYNSDGLAIMEVTEFEGSYQMVDFLGNTNGKISEETFFENGNSARIIRIGCKLVLKLLEKNQMTLDDLSMIVPLSTSQKVWGLHCDMFAYPLEKVFFDNLIDGGHMGAVDIIRNLGTVVDKKLLKKDDYLITFGIGMGTSWSLMLLKVL